MFYIDSLEISNMRVNIRLHLEGGEEISDHSHNSLSAAIRVYIPKLEVEALLLRFAGFVSSILSSSKLLGTTYNEPKFRMSKTGLFVSEHEMRRLLIRHYTIEAVQNSHKLLTNVSYLGNPAQAGRKFATGFFHLVSEPFVGARRLGTFSGFFTGLQSGFTVLVANVTSGLTESVHGLSLSITSAYGESTSLPKVESY